MVDTNVYTGFAKFCNYFMLTHVNWRAQDYNISLNWGFGGRSGKGTVIHLNEIGWTIFTLDYTHLGEICVSRQSYIYCGQLCRMYVCAGGGGCLLLLAGQCEQTVWTWRDYVSTAGPVFTSAERTQRAGFGFGWFNLPVWGLYLETVCVCAVSHLNR